MIRQRGMMMKKKSLKQQRILLFLVLFISLVSLIVISKATKEADLKAAGETGTSRPLYITDPAPDKPAHTPALVSAIKFTDVANFELGGTAIDASGYPWSWGYNGDGRTGIGKSSGYLGGMKRLPFFVDNDIKVKEVASSYRNVFVISEAGELYGWGNNESGQLGIGRTGNQNTPQKALIPEKVAMVDIADDLAVVATYAVTESGKVYAFGSTARFMIPFSGVGGSTPKEVKALTELGQKENGIQKIVVGYEHVNLLTGDGNVYTWGANSYGSLGRSGAGGTPLKVDLGGVKVKDMDTRYYNSMAVTEDGKLYQWGGIFGRGSTAISTVSKPELVSFDKTSADYLPQPKKIYAGRNSSAFIDQHGRTWVWGTNVYYQFMQDGPLYGTVGTTARYDYKNPLRGKLDDYLKEATQLPKSLGDGDTQYNYTVPKAPVFSHQTISGRFNMTVLNGYRNTGVWSDIDDAASKKHPTIYDKKYYQTVGERGKTNTAYPGPGDQQAIHKNVYMIDSKGRRLVYVVRKDGANTVSGNFYVAEDSYNSGWFVDNRQTEKLPTGVTEETSVPAVKEDEQGWIELATEGEPNDFTGTQNTEVPFAVQMDIYESSTSVIDPAGNLYKQTYNGSGNIAWGWDYDPAYDSNSNGTPNTNGLYDSYNYELMFMRGAPRVSPTTVTMNHPVRKIYKSEADQKQEASVKVVLGTASTSTQLNLTVNPTLKQAKYVKIPFDPNDVNSGIEVPTQGQFDAAYASGSYETGDLIDLNGWSEDELTNTDTDTSKILKDDDHIVVTDNCILWVMTETNGYNADLVRVDRQVYDNYYTNTKVYHDGLNVEDPKEKVYEATDKYVIKTEDSKDSKDEDMSIYGLPLDKNGDVITSPALGYDEVTLRAFEEGDPEYDDYISGWYYLEDNESPKNFKLSDLKYLETTTPTANKHVHTFKYKRDPKGWVTITYKGRHLGSKKDITPFDMKSIQKTEEQLLFSDDHTETVKKSKENHAITLERKPVNVPNAQVVYYAIDDGEHQKLNGDKNLEFDTISDRDIPNMEVIIFYSQAEFYGRQVIMNGNDDIVVPSEGYFRLENLDSDSSDILETYNMKVKSGASDTIDFKKVQLSVNDDNQEFRVAPVIPEMYKYHGYRVSTQGAEEHENAALNTTPLDEMRVDYSKSSKYYVTIYLEPSVESQDIPFYNWDYKLNDFGKITEKE